jgi:uncharacterized RDD family membrane protein YckC
MVNFNYCPECGNSLKLSAKFCNKCGQNLYGNGDDNNNKYIKIDYSLKYSSIFKRLTSFIIDIIILFLIVPILLYTVMTFNTSGFSGETQVRIFFFLVLIVIPFIYYAIMESTRFQGTLGKILIGCKVVDKRGNKLTIFKSSIRSALKLTFAFFYLVFIFSNKKQAIHDMICNTYVVDGSHS